MSHTQLTAADRLEDVAGVEQAADLRVRLRRLERSTRQLAKKHGATLEAVPTRRLRSYAEFLERVMTLERNQRAIRHAKEAA